MADLNILESVSAISVDLITDVGAGSVTEVIMGPPGRSIASADLVAGVLTVTFSDGSTQGAGDLKPAVRALVNELFPQFGGLLGYPAGNAAAIEALIVRKAELEDIGDLSVDFAAQFENYLVPVVDL